MGNCLTISTKVMAEDEPSRPASISESTRSNTEDTRRVAGVKKTVRFKVEEEKEGGSSGDVLRIRVVVSQKELKQILNDKENNLCTLGEMIAELRMKGRTISEVEIGDKNGSWRPALESIPEEFQFD